MQSPYKKFCNPFTTLRMTMVLVLLLSFPILAQEQLAKEQPAEFSADKVSYNEKLQTITASGNVVVTQDNRQLFAEAITYNQQTKTVVASGGVTILEDGGIENGGQTLKAERVEVADDLKNGIINNVLVRLNENARFAANSAIRSEGVINTLKEARFTPCPACNGKSPLWELRADTITHNEAEQRIYYKDTTLEVAGVPVLWLPYFFHADPSINRKSGFLPPTLASSSDRGLVFEAPYYIDINTSTDLTVTPILTTEAGSLLSGTYRQRFKKGEIEFRGSGGYVDIFKGTNIGEGYDAEGHIDAAIRFDLNENWRLLGDFERTSDRNYLRRFGFNNGGLYGSDILTSRLALERFDDNQYFAAKSYGFQGLRTDDDTAETPLILPELGYHYRSKPIYYGGRFEVEAGAVSLTRSSGTDSHRLSLGGRWERQDITNQGGEVTWFTDLDMDYYQRNDFVTSGVTKDGFESRFLPSAGVLYKHPFVRDTGKYQQLLEPVAGLVLAPNSGQSDDIPNEDAQVFEFDEHNIFESNRFNGEDRISSGSRIDYGLNTGFYGLWDSRINAFAGQSYRFHENREYGNGSGLVDHFSDYIGSVSVSLPRQLSLQNRFRVNKDSLKLARNEVSLNITNPITQWRVDYLSLDEQANTLLGEREEVSGEVSTIIYDNYLLSSSIARDIENDATRYVGLGLAWYHECISVALDYRRNFTEDERTPDENVVMLRANFDHLSASNALAYLRGRNRIMGRELRYGVD